MTIAILPAQSDTNNEFSFYNGKDWLDYITPSTEAVNIWKAIIAQKLPDATELQGYPGLKAWHLPSLVEKAEKWLSLKKLSKEQFD